MLFRTSAKRRDHGTSRTFHPNGARVSISLATLLISEELSSDLKDRRLLPAAAGTSPTLPGRVHLGEQPRLRTTLPRRDTLALKQQTFGVDKQNPNLWECDKGSERRRAGHVNKTRSTDSSIAAERGCFAPSRTACSTSTGRSCTTCAGLVPNGAPSIARVVTAKYPIPSARWTERTMTVFTRLRRVSDSSRFERCRVIGAATEAAYRPACCGALAIGIAMASAAAAAAVQVHSNSSRSCFSSSVLAWTTQTMASSAYCRN